ncbi:substrate-binding and VWA domain-containing protein [Rhodococcus gordoniae]|uniref:substrate-binding and VWA domain-containing protein n=1 Tax=Rhodococcus gordoniae TaxID=223392 RepID=UPI0020CE8449|nr:substrate-binding and VWA domain-containing protein [Rhodococcus gordoniae]UTT49726.1 substrate-binding and VWA domain-containing protein [Rhodococcus gordoniae]
MARESEPSDPDPPVRRGGKREGARPGRRRMRRLVVPAILVLAAGSIAFLVVEDGRDCDVVERYTVAVSSDLAPVIGEIAPPACAEFEVVEQEPGEVSARIAADDAPDLWIPAGGWWASWAGTNASGPVRTVSTPLATTPLVLAGEPGGVEPVPDWQSALSSPDLVFGNPLRSGPAAGAIRAVLAEAAGDPVAIGTVRPVMAPLAERELARDEEAPAGSELLENVVSDGGKVVSTEQQVDTYRRVHERDLGTAVPGTGTPLVDYPLVVTARGERYDRVAYAATVLIDALHTPEGLDRLARYGFRDGNGRVLPGDRGVGLVPVLELQDESVAEEAMNVWALQALPVRTVFAVDVSASMNRNLGDESRIELVRRAALAANDVLPGSVSAGLWLFGGGAGGAEYVEAAPIRRFDSVVEGRTHRDRLTALVAQMAGTADESTALYDTILAAFRYVQDSYDLRAANSVVVVTDGADEGSRISKGELLATLAGENEPPVRVVTIGLGEDVDSVTLEQIAEATGGTSYRTSDPLDITDLVVAALADRTGG